MLLPDVNILVSAHREDSPHHAPARAWLEKTLAGPEPLGICDQVLSGFLRVVTHPRVFVTPSPLERALAFADYVRAAPRAVPVAPGGRHWRLFSELCLRANAKGNLIPDAWFAALALECGAEWITMDRDYARFPGLRWRSPLP